MYLPESTKASIIELYQKKYKQVLISRKLKIAQSTVSRVLHKYNITNTTDNKRPPERKSSFDHNDTKVLREINKKNQKQHLERCQLNTKRRLGKTSVTQRSKTSLMMKTFSLLPA
ncbi:hypothetical protein DMUE_0119 [Dictyocoela muelleri]|nr:hypothetical protein DMUE_0119 [Dictyocoela muelleri]